MTTGEWVAACLASRPPLTQAQIAALRPVFAPVIPHMRAAPAVTAGAAPARTATQESREGHSQ